VSRPVSVVIFHPTPGPAAGPLTRIVASARAAQAERHEAAFLAAGASDARIATDGSDVHVPFGERLAALVPTLGDGGLIVLGSGAVPLATSADVRAFVATAAAERPGALTNNRYSADIVAIACAREVLQAAPDLLADNALPRWLADVAGIPVRDRRAGWRLGVDIDGPLDLVLLGPPWTAELPTAMTDRVRDRLARLRVVVADPEAEVLVAGRTSPRVLRWLERFGAARTRALVEERGMRTAPPEQRPPHSVLGTLLETFGPGGFVAEVSALGDAALLDTRVLMAHRSGRDEGGWPAPEDRFAADLLRAEAIADPWLRDLTTAVLDAPIPILLGGHTLVGPGLPLAIAGPTAEA
jgi:hypothetical protein